VQFLRATRQVVISIAGEPHWLWRAVDQNGIVLDVLVQRRRDTRAAQRLMKRLLEIGDHPAPRHDHGQAPLLRSGAGEDGPSS
jgi:DDE domain